MMVLAERMDTAMVCMDLNSDWMKHLDEVASSNNGLLDPQGSL